MFRNLARPALASAWLAAIGASICCVVPLLLVLAGVSGAWIANLTALDPWRPWFIGATLACLSLAHWTVHKARAQCRNGESCADARSLQRRGFWLWIATAAIMLLLLFPYYITWFI